METQQLVSQFQNTALKMSSSGITLCGCTILLHEDIDQEIYSEVVLPRTDRDAIPIIPQ